MTNKNKTKSSGFQTNNFPLRGVPLQKKSLTPKFVIGLLLITAVLTSALIYFFPNPTFLNKIAFKEQSLKNIVCEDSQMLQSNKDGSVILHCKNGLYSLKEKDGKFLKYQDQEVFFDLARNHDESTTLRLSGNEYAIIEKDGKLFSYENNQIFSYLHRYNDGDTQVEFFKGFYSIITPKKELLDVAGYVGFSYIRKNNDGSITIAPYAIESIDEADLKKENLQDYSKLPQLFMLIEKNGEAFKYKGNIGFLDLIRENDGNTTFVVFDKKNPLSNTKNPEYISVNRAGKVIKKTTISPYNEHNNI